MFYNEYVQNIGHDNQYITERGKKMTFDFSAYEAVFPPKAPEIQTDSAVEGYNPTAEEAQTSAKVESAVDAGEQNMPSNNAQPPKTVENADNGINDHETGKTSAEGENEP